MRTARSRMVETLDHGAGLEAHDPIGDPNRNDVRRRRRTNIVVEVWPARRAAIEPVSRQQAKGSRAVPAVARKLHALRRMVGRIVKRISVIDEVALESLTGKIQRTRDVVRVEPGI